MLCQQLHIFPVIMAVYLPVAFIITYAMAVHYGHVEPLFPYISDTGTIPPESCVFGQLLNIYAALTGWCMYLRYKQVRRYYHVIEMEGIEPHSDRSRSVRRKQIANKVCLGIGVVTALGISIVANFQEDNIMEVHFLGAVMAFGGAGVYCWIQTVLSFKMSHLPQSHSWCRLLRVVLAVVHAICFLVMLIATKLSLDKFPYSLKMIKKWKSSDPGYPEHLCATFAEWIMAIVSSAYFLTFVGELKIVQAKIHILPKNRSGESNNNNTVLPSGAAETANGNVVVPNDDAETTNGNTVVSNGDAETANGNAASCTAESLVTNKDGETSQAELISE